MRKIQSRHWMRAALYSWPVLLVFTAVVFLTARSAFYAYRNLDVIRARYAEARIARENAEARRADIERRLSELSNPYGLEKELRERYNVRRPGEEAVIFVRRGAPSSSPAEAEPATIWDRVQSYFSSFSL